MATYQVEALIYRRKALDEKNTLITAFTPLGKKLFKVNNTLLKKVYLSAYAHVQLIASQRSGLDRIYDSEVIDSFKVFAADIEQMKLAGYFYSVLDQLTLVDDHNSDLYHVLLKYLNILKNEKNQLIKNDFEREVLQTEGIYSADVTNKDFEVIIDGYRKGVFHED